jgi:hypothetical protein
VSISTACRQRHSVSANLTVTGLPTGPITAGTPVTRQVAFVKPMVAGEDYFGELLLGPPTAPTALKVPITIRRL